MIQYKVRYAVCRKCGKQIRKGSRRFGPAQVRCGHCEAILQTGFDQWADLPMGRKVAVVLGEIVTPSFINVPGCQGLLVWALVHPFFWMMLNAPFIAIAMSGDPAGKDWLMVLGSLVYPVLLFVRLACIIHESNAYARDGAIPVWK